MQVVNRYRWHFNLSLLILGLRLRRSYAEKCRDTLCIVLPANNSTTQLISGNAD